MKTNYLFYVIAILFLFQSCDKTTIEETIAYSSKDEVWQDFRNKFPFHLQTIGITEIEEDESFQLIISEPPPHISKYEIDDFFSKYKHNIDIHTHQIGVDGWVKDVSIVLDNLSEKKIENLVNELSELLFHTPYKSYALDLSKTHLENEKEKLNYQITAAELESWLMSGNEKFYVINNEDKNFSISEILNNNNRGVFYSSSPGFVIWSISQNDICSSENEARQFAVDSDLILGAISDNGNIVIIGRERELSVFNYPPLRTETIMMLANANDDELSQSYERNQMFAGKLDNGKDWAPIYLSDELKHTEYGSLLNITDQLLKSWSQNGETDYEFFNYQIPTEWAFDKPLSKSLNTQGVTFNWNTKGAAYLISYDDYEVTALNRTGALPVSYFPEGDIDEYSEKQAKKMEEIAYDYFANQNDPNLIRVVQYAALYQIFSNYGVGCYSSYQYNISKHTDRTVEKQFHGEAKKFLNLLLSSNLDEITQSAFTDYNPQDELEEFYLELLIKPSFISKLEQLINIVESIKSQYGGDGIAIFSYMIANPRDLEGLDNIPLSNPYQFDEHSVEYLFSSSYDFLEIYKYVRRFNLNHFDFQIEEIYKKLVSINETSSRDWIKTPTILISWNLDSLVSMGGHNLNSRVVPFQVDKSLKAGQYKIITSNGNKKILISKADIGKINPSFLRNVEDIKSGGLKKFANNKDLPIRKRSDVISPSRGDGGGKGGNGNGGGRGFNNRSKQNINSKKGNDKFIFAENRKGYKVTEVDGKQFIQHPTNENILFPIEKLNSVEALTIKMRGRNYLKQELNVISFVEDFKTNHILNNYFGKRNLNHSIKSVSDLKNIFTQNNQKSFVLFGHIENGKFAFGKGNNLKLKLSEIEVAARESNVNVFFFGCKSSFAREGGINSGVANNIYSTEAASRLGYAVNKNNNTWGLFNDLAYKDVKIIITEEPLGNLGYIETKLTQQRTVGIVAGVVAGTGVVVGIIMNSEGSEDGDDDEEDKYQNLEL